MREKILARLIEIRDFPETIVSPNLGICCSVCRYLDLSYGELNVAIESWPEFSGTIDYPIKDFNEERNDPHSAYTEMKRLARGWDKNHPYGAARLRLLDHLIAEFSKEVERVTHLVMKMSDGPGYAWIDQNNEYELVFHGESVWILLKNDVIVDQDEDRDVLSLRTGTTFDLE